MQAPCIKMHQTALRIRKFFLKIIYLLDRSALEAGKGTVLLHLDYGEHSVEDFKKMFFTLKRQRMYVL